MQRPSRQRQAVLSQAFYTPGPVSHREPHHVQWCNQAPHMAPTIRYPKAPTTKPKVRPVPARAPIATSAGSQRPNGLAQSIAMAFKPWKAIRLAKRDRGASAPADATAEPPATRKALKPTLPIGQQSTDAETASITHNEATPEHARSGDKASASAQSPGLDRLRQEPRRRIACPQNQK